MVASFRQEIAAVLPSEERLRLRLVELPERQWVALAGVFAAGLPELDAVVTLPGAVPLARALAQARGLPLLEAHLPGDVNAWLPTIPPSGEVVLVTEHLAGGAPELEAVAHVTAHGLRVVAVAAAVERTSAGARSRLETQGVRVYAALQLADTPGGLVFERRAPRRWRERHR
ncbi:hypothetical protein V3W47_16390 [Deinococcus sp. YIM 134068]|uniref:hypothetical protein n=1 Tax=Deinococcus lichenicola TaxID=3118910 RepID=UPI002F9446B3